MNYLVYLDNRAGELEKILSGVKTMLVKDSNSTQPTAHPVNPGDSLYFLRGTDECTLRVKATVVQVLLLKKDESVARALKEVQPKLRFTEDQYNYWSVKQEVVLIEFEPAKKIPVFQIDPNKTKKGSDWIAFETFNVAQNEE